MSEIQLLVDLFRGKKSRFSLILCSSVIALFNWSFVVLKCKEKQPGLSRHLPSPFLLSFSLPLVLLVPSLPSALAPHSCCLQYHYFSLIFFFQGWGVVVVRVCLAALRNQLLHIYFRSLLIYFLPFFFFAHPLFYFSFHV